MKEQGTRKYKSYQLCSNVEKDTAKAEGLDAALARCNSKLTTRCCIKLVMKIYKF